MPLLSCNISSFVRTVLSATNEYERTDTIVPLLERVCFHAKESKTNQKCGMSLIGQNDILLFLLNYNGIGNSIIATGTNWNGNEFFGIKKR